MPPSRRLRVPAMWTVRPVASVAAGTVAVNTAVTDRSCAVADTAVEFGERLNDVSTERTT